MKRKNIYRGASVGFECETGKNDGKIRIKRRPLILVLVNRNCFDFGIVFTEAANGAVHSVSASELFAESENPNFPGKKRRESRSDVRVSEIRELGRDAVMELEVRGRGHERMREK